MTFNVYFLKANFPTILETAELSIQVSLFIILIVHNFIVGMILEVIQAYILEDYI